MRPAGYPLTAGGPSYTLESLIMKFMTDKLLLALMPLALLLGVLGLAIAAGWMMITAVVLLFGAVVVFGVDTNGGLRT